tara:strand:- start:1078 stop:2082 length:1005 start_codon:yes stop_codon:yes gene_type:complete
MYSSILITGGTGSFGKAFLKKLLNEQPNFERIIVFSRDELKQWELRQELPDDKYPQLRFFLGDIRDKERLKRAFKGIDVVVHAAALKQVPAAEYNPIEFIKTNILGAQNIIEATLDRNVKKVVALSTDKAACPVNLYGATKLCSDKLFVAANNISGGNHKFSIVRYGNVMGSRGSVIPYFLSKAKSGVLPITSPKMTRFNISLDECLTMVLDTIFNSIGGEIFIPKIPSFNILDVAKAIGPNCKHEIIGLRPGEKIHEEMITIHDSLQTVDLGEKFAILPFDGSIHKKFTSLGIDYKRVSEGFSYNSGNNSKFLSVNQIQELIKIHLDSNFEPY